MSTPEQGRQPSRVPPISSKPQWTVLPNVETSAALHLKPGVQTIRGGLKSRKSFAALGLGVVALGIYAYTIYAFSQDHLMEEIEAEVKVLQTQASKTQSD